ncbi:FtsW-like protein FtsW [Mycobacteroides abscessus subsp. abscessus]|nr:FtsW-like protein FtsW [Mycobacteroides abscessus subsp. abscessus]
MFGVIEQKLRAFETLKGTISLSIASPTRPGKKPHNGSSQSWGARLKRNVVAFGESQYRRLSISPLRGVPILLLFIAIGMTFFGIIMVLSASSVEQISMGLSPFSQVSRQGIFALLGFIGLGVMAFMPVRWYRRQNVLYALMVVAILVQLLTVIIGKDVNGNRNWIVLGPFQVQPSEFSKLIFAMWGSWVLIHQGNIARFPRKGLFPLLLGLGPLVLFILMGHDVGTVLVYALMLLALLWFAGFSNRAMVTGLGVAVLAGAIAVFSSPNRMARVLGIFGHCEGATCDQSNAGLAALATGGFWGVGLGRSRQKYNYLPEAHNDYIFAIVGEELGLIGTLMIILLYLGLVFCCVRIMMRTADRFIALTTGAIMVWLMGQAMINIAMVTGFLPVIGIPLPLISYGGSSLITSLVAIGVLIAFARQTPLLTITDMQGNYAFAPQTDMKDEKRRRPLNDMLVRENRTLQAQGDKAGWDIMVFLRNLGIGVGQSTRASQQSARNTAPSSTAPRGSRSRAHQQRPQSTSRRASGAAERSADRRRTASSRTAPQRKPGEKSTEPHRRTQPRTESASPQSRATHPTSGAQRNYQAPQHDQTQEPSAAPKQEERLPEGLAPIKKLRQKNRDSR